MDLSARTLEALDWPFLTAALSSRARTAAGVRRAAHIPLSTDIPAIERALDAVGEVLTLMRTGVGAPPVGGVADVEEPVRRSARGEVLDLDDLRAAGATLAALLDLRAFARAHKRTAAEIARLAEPIELDRRLCTTFGAAFDDRGELSETTYPVLGELRRRIASLERRVRGALESLLSDESFSENLQDRYVTVRGDRFVVPVKAQAKNLGLGIVHDASRTGQTVFVEPHQVVPLNNERRITEAELIAEERRIRAELSALLGRHADAVGASLEAATEIDLACARADLAHRLDATRPAVGSQGIIRLAQARHPVLALRSDDVVGNDLSIDKTRRVLIFTGPNAGGKTVALKTLGLCALLARAGCFVPAGEGARVDCFARILADIGDQQTVHEGLSSFSGHLTTLRSMLEVAGESTLLLLDEIASGTDPAQGGPLARALIERLADGGARIVATTHYAQVKAMAAHDDRVQLSALEYRDGRPTYRVVPGVAGESHALGAALRVGIPADVVERARMLMDEGERALHDAVAALEVERAKSEKLSRAAADAEAALAARERSLAQREERIKRHAREMEEQAAATFVDRLREAEFKIRAIVADLQRGPTSERASEAREALLELRDLADLPAQQAPPARAPVIGDRVRVTRLGAVGDVISISGGELEVRAGLMTMRVGPDEVTLLTSAAPTRKPESRAAQGRTRAGAQSSSPAPGSSSSLDALLRMPANTLDLRGERVEAGLAKLESFLDDSMLASLDGVFVLHGHGTGAMKAAVRKALASSPYVRAFGPAAPEQGGDAFTVARLRE